MEPGEKQSSVDLVGIKPLCFVEAFLICDDSEWVVSSLQPHFRSQLDGEQLSIPNVTILLCWGQFPRVISARLEAWRFTG